VIAFGIALSLLLIPVSGWLRSFLSNLLSGTLVTPFIAVTWTILYYRLRSVKEAPVETPAPPGAPA
jgi:hypothetical protein